MQLPENIDPVEFDDSYRLDPTLWLAAVHDILVSHKIQAGPLETFKDGSNLIAADDRIVVKIFPRFHRHQWESEWRVLQRLSAQELSVPIPKLLATGERTDGWTYVVLTRLPGVTLESVWPRCSAAEKQELLRNIGAIMAKIHSVPVSDLCSLEPQWQAFLEEQRAGYLARHRRLGMPEWFLNGAAQFVDRYCSILPIERPVILTGEYTPFNLLVDGTPGDLRISGMIDFGDAMIGFREYDFLGPILFLCGGDASLIATLLDGYGYSISTDDRLQKRLLLLAILHRYSNLKFQIRIDRWESKVQSLPQLEALIFGTTTDENLSLGGCAVSLGAEPTQESI